MNLSTRVCEILEIEKPIVLAGMGGASCPALAAAVSNAGGLGVLGAAGCGPSMLRDWIKETRELTDKPFGVDTLLPASVRRANYDDQEGPTPQDLIPERQEFAREFMEKEGLDASDLEALQSLQRKTIPGEPAPLTKEFFEAQMEVVIQERVPVYASGLGNPGPWMNECDIESEYDAGDHTIVIGRVTDFELNDHEKDPLAFFRGAYGTFI